MVAEQLKRLAAGTIISALLLWLLPSISCAQDPAPSARAANGQTIQVLADADYFPALIKLLDSADSSVDLAMFVFRIGKGKNNRPAKIRDTLIRTAQRGVKVRVFLERSGYDEKLNDTNRKVAKQLSAGGVRVIFESPKTTTHNKMVVVDRRYAIIGSHNFTQSALKYNHELSLLVDDRQLAGKLITYMENSIQP
jgi:phosphatidylserine/phosphatidylglycerophosphate/cardiolipin synthase-like enzyme